VISKRVFFPVVLVVALATAPAAAEVRYGIDFGVNVSSLDYEREDSFVMTIWKDRHPRPSPALGGALELFLRDRVSLATGLRYVQHGNRVEVDAAPFATEFRIVQHYLSLPVILSVRPLPSRRFSIGAGPEFAVLVAASSVIRPSPGTWESIQEDMDPTNLSVDVQAGLDFPMGAQTGAATLRYSHGLLGVAREDRWASDWRTRGVEGLFGVRW
jgi:hypothetical protein